MIDLSSNSPTGFAVAHFERGGEVITEIPNLLICSKKPAKSSSSPAVLKKPSSSSLKRPAASTELDPPPAVRCHLEFYKRSNHFALRQSEPPRKNILAIRNASWTKEQLRKVAQEAQQKIQAGEPLDEVSAWVERSVGSRPQRGESRPRKG